MARTITPAPPTALDRRLAVLAMRAPGLIDLVAFYRASIPLLLEAQPRVLKVELVHRYVVDKLSAGKPALVDENLPLDIAETTGLFVNLCGCVEHLGSEDAKKTSGGLAGLFRRGKVDAENPTVAAIDGGSRTIRTAAALQLRALVQSDRMNLVPVWESLLRANAAGLNAISRRHKIDEGLLRLLAQASLRPAFRAWAAELAADTSHWHRPNCPLCGGDHIFSEISGKEGERRARCGTCGAAWVQTRLACIHCHETNHRMLGRISIEAEEEKYFVQTCDTCKGYDKIINVSDPHDTAMLQIEDALSAHYDVLAQQRGYMRNPGAKLQ